MDYLFFDIECCDGTHICSFGYVIADENLNLLEKRDILINPQKPFQLQRRGGSTRYIELAYREKQFYRSPNFKALYPEIKALLEKKDRFIGGHSLHSDILYLNIACARYGLPLIPFSFFDTQILYGQKKSNRLNSLDTIAEELSLPFEHFHRSDEDAHMSMRVLKALAEEEKVSPSDFFHSCPACISSVGELLEKERKKEIHKHISPYFERMLPTKELSLPSLQGKRFYFHKQMEREDPLKIGGIVQELVNHGGIYVSRLNQADYWVYSGDENDTRYQEILADKTMTLTPLSLHALLTQMGVTEITPLPSAYQGEPEKSALVVKFFTKRGQGQPRCRSVIIEFSSTENRKRTS